MELNELFRAISNTVWTKGKRDRTMSDLVRDTGYGMSVNMYRSFVRRPVNGVYKYKCSTSQLKALCLAIARVSETDRLVGVPSDLHKTYLVNLVRKLARGEKIPDRVLDDLDRFSKEYYAAHVNVNEVKDEGVSDVDSGCKVNRGSCT